MACGYEDASAARRRRREEGERGRTWVMSSTTLNENAGDLWRCSRNCPFSRLRTFATRQTSARGRKGSGAHQFQRQCVHGGVVLCRDATRRSRSRR